MLFGEREADGSDELVAPELSEREKQEAEAHTSVSAHVVHEAIRHDGEEELNRSTSALAWSGLAAGLSMGFSLIAEGLLRSHLPDQPWRPLIAKFGYSFGFLMVIIGRQQLFTENTLTAILPLLSRRTWSTFFRVARLWATVLAANLVGAHLMAWVLGNTPMFKSDVQHAFSELGHEALAVSYGMALLRGVFAGWLIAMLVWMRSALDTGQIALIVIVTYVVALGGFTHIIAGSIEVLFVVMTGGATWLTYAAGYMLPTLIGNIIGGVSLVSALNHAQVMAGRRTRKESKIVPAR